MSLPRPMRLLAASAALALAWFLLAAAAPASGAEPSASVAPSSTPSATPAPSATPSPSPVPTPTATPSPTPSFTPIPSATPTATATPTPTPTPTPTIPVALNLFRGTGFRFQDPYYSACTATSAMDMLNFVNYTGRGGPGFIWRRSRSSVRAQAMLTWERAHDTLTTGRGSDPHGWRNALNYYGWGSAALRQGQRVYDDAAYRTYGAAIKDAVRAMIRTGKPVGMLGWAGRHAQMITGYYGLIGDPFALNSTGAYANAFGVAGLYVSDPLRADGFVNTRISFARLQTTTNYRLRFRAYTQTDSLLDDPYTAGIVRSRSEWYGRFVLVIPRR